MTFEIKGRTVYQRTCWRCGIDWISARNRHVDDAPCIDCRDALADEGTPKTVWLRDRAEAFA